MLGVLLVFLMIGQMFCASVRANQLHYEPVNPRPPKADEVWSSLWDCKWALLFPVILIVGIRLGVFTPSEAGAFAVVYAFIVGKFVYKELTWKGMIDVIKNTAIDNGDHVYNLLYSEMSGGGICKRSAAFPDCNLCGLWSAVCLPEFNYLFTEFDLRNVAKLKYYVEDGV